VSSESASSPSVPPAPHAESVLLRLSEERLRLLLESARDFAIFGMDPQRRVNYWSVGAERLFGYSEKQMLGLTGDLIFTPEDRVAGAPEREAETAIRNGRAEDERWHMRLDGSRFFASGVMAPIVAADGTLVGFVKIARDLTERKVAEMQLQLAKEDLEQRVKQRTADLDIANEELRVSNEQLRIEMEQRLQAELLRREAIRRMAEVQEEERRRLSRELHDELGQHCAALLLNLRSLEWESADRGRRLEELCALASRIGVEVHSIAVELRPTSLDDIGLPAALASLIELWSKRTRIEVDLHTIGLEERLPRGMELALYRIVQEALTNVMKHAAARVVSVIVERRPDEVRAVIEDDGAGFEPGTVPISPQRLGLIGMNERAAEFGGSVSVESDAGRGTTVFVRIPLSGSGTPPGAARRD
jgi:PAS domain S-box-containing protein